MYIDGIDKIFSIMHSYIFLQITTMWKKINWSHAYCFSLVCVLWCVFKLLLSEKKILHWLHVYSFSLVCVLSFRFKIPPPKKDFEHWLHWYDMIWFLRCKVNFSLTEKDFIHWFWYVTLCEKNLYTQWRLLYWVPRYRLGSIWVYSVKVQVGINLSI